MAHGLLASIRGGPAASARLASKLLGAVEDFAPLTGDLHVGAREVHARAARYDGLRRGAADENEKRGDAMERADAAPRSLDHPVARAGSPRTRPNERGGETLSRSLLLPRA